MSIDMTIAGDRSYQNQWYLLPASEEDWQSTTITCPQNRDQSMHSRGPPPNGRTSAKLTLVRNLNTNQRSSRNWCKNTNRLFASESAISSSTSLLPRPPPIEILNVVTPAAQLNHLALERLNSSSVAYPGHHR